MQLDNTLIAVRARNNYDLLDLTVIVFKSYFSRFLGLALMGWLPWMVMNFVLLFPIAWISIENFNSIRIFAQTELHLRFLYLFTILVVMQAPLAMLPLTYSIGQEMFRVKPSWKDTWTSYRSLLLLKIIQLGFLRGVFPAMMLVGIAAYSGELLPFVEFFLLPVVVCGPTLLVRATRPFAPEVIALEQGMTQSKEQTQWKELRKGYSRRMKALHQLLSSELFIRFFYVALAASVLVVLSVCSVLWLLQLLVPTVTWTWLHSLFLIPIVYFFVSIFTSIFRFVSYIDSRILLEGWEVRLRFISEAEKLRID